MAETSYNLLETLLESIARGNHGRAGQATIQATVHAYSFIDSAYRLRQAVMVAPGFKHDKGYKHFIAETAELEKLRHVVQHQNREISNIESLRLSALGSITWFFREESDSAAMNGFTLHAGSWFPGQVSFGPTFDLTKLLPRAGVSSIALRVANARVDFTRILEIEGRLVSLLEQEIEKHASSKERLGSDMILTMRIVPERGR